MLANKVKGKRPRDQHNKTSSGISLPKKRTVKTAQKRETTKQPCISGWVTDDDASCAQKTDATLNTLTKSSVAATPPLSIQSNQMLSPILSQPRKCRAIPIFGKKYHPHLRGPKSGCKCNIAEGRYCGM